MHSVDGTCVGRARSVDHVVAGVHSKRYVIRHPINTVAAPNNRLRRRAVRQTDSWSEIRAIKRDIVARTIWSEKYVTMNLRRPCGQIPIQVTGSGRIEK